MMAGNADRDCEVQLLLKSFPTRGPGTEAPKQTGGGRERLPGAGEAELGSGLGQAPGRRVPRLRAQSVRVLENKASSVGERRAGE